MKTPENDKPDKEVEYLLKYKEMEDKDNDDEFVITYEDFFMVLSIIESKKSTTYDFIIKAGIRFKPAFLKLFKRFISS